MGVTGISTVLVLLDRRTGLEYGGTLVTTSTTPTDVRSRMSKITMISVVSIQS